MSIAEPLRSVTAVNRDFYDALWRRARVHRAEEFNTWPMIAGLLPDAPERLEIGPGLQGFEHATNGHDANFGRHAVAFVEQQNRAGCKLANDAGHDLVDVGRSTFESAGAPPDAREPAPAEGVGQPEIFDPDRWTESRRPHAGSAQDRECVVEFAADPPGGCAPKRGVRMRVGVMRDLVPGGGDGAHQFRVARRIFADHKKRRARAVPREEFENARRIIRVGAIVNRQPDFAAWGREAPAHSHQPLRARDEQMIREQRVGGQPEGDRDRRRRPAHE